MTLVNVKDELEKSKNKMNNATVLFIILFALTIALSYVLIITREEHLTLNMVFTMIVSVSFVFYAISFFSLSYPRLNNSLRYYQGYDTGVKTTDIAIIKSISDSLTEVNGFDAYAVSITVFDGLDEIDKVLYVFDNNISISKNKKLAITSYQRIIISIEDAYAK